MRIIRSMVLSIVIWGFMCVEDLAIRKVHVGIVVYAESVDDGYNCWCLNKSRDVDDHAVVKLDCCVWIAVNGWIVVCSQVFHLCMKTLATDFVVFVKFC